MAEKATSFEAPVWAEIQGEWRSLFGGFSTEGVSVEWHDFESGREIDWAKSFHPDSLEICVNLEGQGKIGQASRSTNIRPQTVAHYAAGRLNAKRSADERHRFLTIEMSRPWLVNAVRGLEDTLKSEVRGFLDNSRGAKLCEFPLVQRVKRTAEEMLKPPLEGPAARFWYHAKIMEIAAHTLTEPVNEFFCERQKRLGLERVERVKAALSRDLENPPTLAQLGREVGCSPFYLSRIFSEHTGVTISRYLRNLRLERASELLRTGQCNVTEAAMAVGYSSLSHFSKAFAEMFGACPCVFPLAGKSGK